MANERNAFRIKESKNILFKSRIDIRIIMNTLSKDGNSLK